MGKASLSAYRIATLRPVIEGDMLVSELMQSISTLEDSGVSYRSVNSSVLPQEISIPELSRFPST